IELCAPATPGPLTLSARFDTAGLDEPHQGSTSAFHVAVVAPAEHTLTIKVSAGDAPIDDAHVRLGPYRATTDAAGVAEIRLAKGRYQLVVWKAGYDRPPTPIEVAGDALVAVEARPEPEPDPDAIWTA